MKKLLTLFTVFLLLTSFTACDNDNDNQEIRVLTENNFADDESLRANFNNNNLVKFLEHPETQQTAKDTGDTGSDIIPVTYNETTEHTFCWDDSDQDSEHTMTLFDSDGLELFSLQANDECVTIVIEAGDYEMRLDHDGRIERTFPIFIINEEKGLVAANNSLNGSKNIFYSALDNFDLIQPATAQTVQQNINTLLSTNECISCNLREALLTGANLSLATLSGSNLTDAILSSTNLSDSTLIGVILDNAILIQANLNGAQIIEKASLVGANLTGAAINDSNLSQANFNAAILTDASLIAATVGSTIFTDAIMIGANLLDTNLNDAILTGTDLTGATFCNNCVCQDSSCSNCGSTSQCSIGGPDLGDSESKKLTVEIDEKDLDTLQAEGLHLNIAIKANDSFNVVWFSNNNYLESNEYEWEQNLEVFETNVFELGEKVALDNAIELELGQTATLSSSAIFGVETGSGPMDSITVINDFEPVYFGLTQQISISSGMGQNLASFVSPDLNNLETGLLTPENEVMLWFEQTETGTVFLEEPVNNFKVDFSEVDEATIQYSGGVWSTK